MITINVSTSGDATWAVESRFLLNDEEEIEAFLEYADAVGAGDRDVPHGRELFEPHVETAAEATDREMSIEDDGWDDPRVEPVTDVTGIDDVDDDASIGVLSYSFTWTAFATVDGNRIHVGDAFETSDGPWFSTLTDEQRLVVHSPPQHGFHDYGLPVNPDDGALVVDGPYQFSEDQLSIVFLRGAGDSGSDGTVDGFVISESRLLGGAFLLVLAVGSASYLLARRSSTIALPGGLLLGGLSRSGSEPAHVGAADRPNSSDGPNASAPAPPAERAATPDPDRTDGTAQEFAHAEADIDSAGDIDPDLLSDEEQVLRLLRQNGGRMKQASIVTETGWSNAKVSQLLSKMDENDEISKLRIGRENLITLPEIDPTAVD